MVLLTSNVIIVCIICDVIVTSNMSQMIVIPGVQCEACTCVLYCHCVLINFVQGIIAVVILCKYLSTLLSVCTIVG